MQHCWGTETRHHTAVLPQVDQEQLDVTRNLLDPRAEMIHWRKASGQEVAGWLTCEKIHHLTALPFHNLSYPASGVHAPAINFVQTLASATAEKKRYHHRIDANLIASSADSCKNFHQMQAFRGAQRILQQLLPSFLFSGHEKLTLCRFDAGLRIPRLESESTQIKINNY